MFPRLSSSPSVNDPEAGVAKAAGRQQLNFTLSVELIRTELRGVEERTRTLWDAGGGGRLPGQYVRRLPRCSKQSLAARLAVTGLRVSQAVDQTVPPIRVSSAIDAPSAAEFRLQLDCKQSGFSSTSTALPSYLAAVSSWSADEA